MLDKLLAAGAYTMANQIDYRLGDRSVNLGSFDASMVVTIRPAMQEIVDELLAPRANTVMVDEAPKAVKVPKGRKGRVDLSDDEPGLGELAGE